MQDAVRVSQWSRLLFSNTHVIVVAEAIGASADPVTSGALQAELSLAQPAVHRVLRVLEEVGLLTRKERAGRTEPLRFDRTAHPFWNAVAQLAQSARGQA